MTAARLALVLRVNALFDLAAGALLLAGTWDGLWDALDLPQGKPALFVQVGGAALWGFAYLLWRAADEPGVRRPASLAGAIADGLAALVILLWFVAGRLDDVGGLGTTLLILITVVLAAFAGLKGLGARAPEGSA
jgi:hypothetical protein